MKNLSFLIPTAMVLSASIPIPAHSQNIEKAHKILVGEGGGSSGAPAPKPQGSMSGRLDQGNPEAASKAQKLQKIETEFTALVYQWILEAQFKIVVGPARNLSSKKSVDVVLYFCQAVFPKDLVGCEIEKIFPNASEEPDSITLSGESLLARSAKTPSMLFVATKDSTDSDAPPVRRAVYTVKNILRFALMHQQGAEGSMDLSALDEEPHRSGFPGYPEGFEPRVEKKIPAMIPILFSLNANQQLGLHDVRSALLRGPLSANVISDAMAHSAEVGRALSLNAGVAEGFTLKEHNLRIFRRLPGHTTCWLTPETTQKLKRQNIEINALLPAVMVLHDIGKPQSFIDGKKEQQHRYTKPMLLNTLEAMGYTQSEINLADALVDNDWIGDYLMGKLTLKEALVGLTKMATALNLSLQDLFRIQMIYFSSDAGSYPSLEAGMFEANAAGCAEPKHQMFVGTSAVHAYFPSSNRFSSSDEDRAPRFGSAPFQGEPFYEVTTTPKVQPNEHAYDVLKHSIMGKTP